MNNSVLDEGATVHDEAPETPAPLFAVRAFRQALFGTPRSSTRYSKYSGTEVETPTRDMVTAEASQPPAATKPADADIPVHGSEKLTKDVLLLEQRRGLDQSASPTKGILLTPGTGAMRRKTVSFGKETKNKEVLISELSVNLAGKCGESSTMMNQEQDLVKLPPQKRQSALTRTLIEMSSKRSPVVDPSGLATPNVMEPGFEVGFDDAPVKLDQHSGDTPHDQTMDLSQPRSRSGQHWKTEFEQYHTRSNNEIKKILQYGQNVKSYAVKKDCEATRLNESLQKETAKAARLEAKVMKLAQQLATMQQSRPETESDQTRLVSELAQQTALVVRYQRKAEHYRAALEKASVGKPAIPLDTDSHFSQEEMIDEAARPQTSLKMMELQKQMRSLEEAADQTKSRAVSLEAENQQLKRSLSRIKQEMMKYETRRHAREDRLLKREERHKKAREQIEQKYTKLEKEHEILLDRQRTGEQSRIRPPPRSQSIGNADNPVRGQSLHLGNENGQARCSSLSPSKRRSLRRSTVDIWTPSSPRDEIDKEGPPSHPTTADEALISGHEIEDDRVLQPIVDNLNLSVQSQLGAPQAELPKNPARIGDIALVMSNRPQDLTKGQQIDPAPSVDANQTPKHTIDVADSMPSAADRPRSLLFPCRPGSRTNTLGSARTSSLSTERAAAAKARLAQRKKGGRPEIS